MIANRPAGADDALETLVGAPRAPDGNSEVAPMNLGAGRGAVPEMARHSKRQLKTARGKNPILAELSADEKSGRLHCSVASPGECAFPTRTNSYSSQPDCGAGVLVWITPSFGRAGPCRAQRP